MYKMSKQLKEDLNSCDYYSQFIKNAIRELKIKGICYVFHKYQVEEIKKYVNKPVTIVENDCGYTLSIARKYREEGIV